MLFKCYCGNLNKILQSFQETSTVLQRVDPDLVKSGFSRKFTPTVWRVGDDGQTNFCYTRIKDNTPHQIKRKTSADESNTPDHFLKGSEQFVFLLIIDDLIIMLHNRCIAHEET